MNSVDETRNYETIGFGIIDNTAYIMINIIWIYLEFKITSNDQIYRRIKYGDNGWNAWIEF